MELKRASLKMVKMTQWTLRENAMQLLPKTQLRVVRAAKGRRRKRNFDAWSSHSEHNALTFTVSTRSTKTSKRSKTRGDANSHSIGSSSPLKNSLTLPRYSSKVCRKQCKISRAFWTFSIVSSSSPLKSSGGSRKLRHWKEKKKM